MTQTRVEHTFVVADLVGFTAFTEAHGDDRAADLAGDFCADVNRLLPAGAEDFKMVGDACLVRVDRAGAAVELALALTGEVGNRHGALAVRAGLHTGPAVSRAGDWFGAALNVAARIADLSAMDEVLVSGATRSAAAPSSAIGYSDRGVVRLRNSAVAVQLFRAEATAPPRRAALPVDPVCRMRVDPSERHAAVRTGGVELSFCSRSCADSFAGSMIP